MTPSDLRQIRQEAGVSTVQLADAMGITTPVVSRVERGLQPITPAYLARMRRALRMIHQQRAQAVRRLERAF